MGFQEDGQYLPGDYVDEGKLLLFMKDEVASRPPRKSQRLRAEQASRKRTRAESQPGQAKRQRGLQGARPAGGGSSSSGGDSNDEEDAASSSLMLMYNTVRGYCSAINELWAHQTSRQGCRWMDGYPPGPGSAF